MDIEEVVKDYFQDLKSSIEKIDPKVINEIALVLYQAFKHGKKIYLIGNGGSATTALHLSCDLTKGTFLNFYDSGEQAIRAISLVDNVAITTAIGNDILYEEIFLQQINYYLEEKDVLIAISASGNSPNIIKALIKAKEKKVVTIGFLGFQNGGRANDFVDFKIIVDSKKYGVCEDVHLMIGHILTECLKQLKIKEKYPQQDTKKKKNI